MSLEQNALSRAEGGHSTSGNIYEDWSLTLPDDAIYQTNLCPEENPPPYTWPYSRTEHKIALVLRWRESATETPHHSTCMWCKNRFEEMFEKDTALLGKVETARVEDNEKIWRRSSPKGFTEDVSLT